MSSSKIARYWCELVYGSSNQLADRPACFTRRITAFEPCVQFCVLATSTTSFALVSTPLSTTMSKSTTAHPYVASVSEFSRRCKERGRLSVSTAICKLGNVQAVVCPSRVLDSGEDETRSRSNKQSNKMRQKRRHNALEIFLRD